MNTIKSLIVLLLVLFMVTGCSKDDDAPPPVVDDLTGSVEVGFTAGMAVTQTRAAFVDGTDITLYVYQRKDITVMDLKTAPHKVVTGKTAAGTGGMSSIVFNESGDNTKYTNTFPLRGDRIYDFVLIVGSKELGYSNGSVYGIDHGQDILSGRAEAISIASNSATVNIKFTNVTTGADAAGNLPHLCSGTAVRVSVTDDLLAILSGSVELGISRAVFKKLPESGTFDFASNPMKLTLIGGGYVSNYNMIANTLAQTVENTTTEVSYEKGVILPYPLKQVGYKNMIDIDFYINVSGGEVQLAAENVEVPVFSPGLRYAFKITMDSEEIQLSLSVEPWDAASWDSAMGGEEVTYLDVIVGSWSNVWWNAGMGGQDGSNIILSVGGWQSATWFGNMGGTNPDGTN